MAGVQGQSNLLEIVLAFRSGCGFPDFLDGRQKQTDEDGDDGDDHQKFD